MTGIGNATDLRLAQSLFWFGLGEPWSIRHEANALVMSRISRPLINDTIFDGTKDVALEKHFYKVDPEFARDLVGFSTRLDYSLLKLSCVIGFVSDDSERSRSFRALIRDLVAVSQTRVHFLRPFRRPDSGASSRAPEGAGDAWAVTGPPSNDGSQLPERP